MKRVRVVAALIEVPEPRERCEPSGVGAGGAGRGVAARPRRFLVQQRLPGVSRANLWEFPGGKVEPGEGDEDALRRECREELGVEVAVGGVRWQTVHEYGDVTVELVLHEARIVAGVPEALGAQALAFLTPREMRGVPFCEADLPIIDELLAREGEGLSEEGDALGEGRQVDTAEGTVAAPENEVGGGDGGVGRGDGAVGSADQPVRGRVTRGA